MKKSVFFTLLALLAALAGTAYRQQEAPLTPGAERIQQAYQHRESDLQVQGQGTVIRLLADDLEGSRHQKFLLQLTTGQTLLVAHNIDLAPRVDTLAEGDTVEFYGEYEWNARGGVIHWTHHDPQRRHSDGWLKHRGKTYQ